MCSQMKELYEIRKLLTKRRQEIMKEMENKKTIGRKQCQQWIDDLCDLVITYNTNSVINSRNAPIVQLIDVDSTDELKISANTGITSSSDDINENKNEPKITATPERSELPVKSNSADNKTSNSGGVFRFLSNKREKVKERKKKKKYEISSSLEDNCSVDTKDSNSIELPSDGPISDTPIVDEEGYIVRHNSQIKANTENHFYSSSDSDSEEEKERKIHIRIKPLTNGTPISASVDELIASAGTLSLFPITQPTRRPNALTLRHKNRRIYTTTRSPTPEEGPIRRSISANHNISKAENDLINVFSSSLSSASTPTGIADQNQKICKNNSFNQNSNPINNKKPSPADRYAALSDLFSVSINDSTTVLSKSMSALILGPSRPRPTSKRNPQMSPQLSHQSSHTSQTDTISRCESISSLSSSDLRMTPISIGSSRGPSPLTLGISESVPIAIALQESVSACFKGTDETKCQVQVIGSLKMAFPAGIVQVLANNPYAAPLTFALNKSSKLEKVFPNKELLIDCIDSSSPTLSSDSINFEVNLSALVSNIRRLYEVSPNCRYYNIDLLKYQMRCLQGAKSTPLQLVSYWKCEPQSTSLKVDYKYNGTALAQLEPLRNVCISVNIDGEPHSMHSRPEGNWNSVSKQAFWRFQHISNKTEVGGLGAIKAKFELSSGPSNHSVIQAQFSCSDTTISGVEFELKGMGYRVSLIKKQISSGRYICEA